MGDEIKKNLSVMTKNVLIELCKKFTLDESGTKDVLMNRLVNFKLEKGESVDLFNIDDDQGAIGFTEIKNQNINGLGVITNTNQNNNGLGVITNTNQNNNGHEMITNTNQNNKELELLKKEIELLRRENDLLNREKQFVSQMSENKSNYLFAHIKNYEGMLDEFSGNSDEYLCAWTSKLETIRKKFKLDDDATRQLISKKLKGRALSWFRSKTEHLEKPISDLLNDMKKLFETRTNKLEKRREFESRVWKFNEKFSEYFHDKIIKANALKIEQEDLIECIIDGIQDKNLQNQARALRFQTTDAFLDSFANVNYDKWKQKSFDKFGSYGQNFKPKKFSESSDQSTSVKAEPNSKNSKSGRQFPGIRCYNCNNYGHYYSACDKPAREKGSCFKCGKLDHKAGSCPPKTESK